MKINSRHLCSDWLTKIWFNLKLRKSQYTKTVIFCPEIVSVFAVYFEYNSFCCTVKRHVRRHVHEQVSYSFVICFYSLYPVKSYTFLSSALLSASVCCFPWTIYMPKTKSVFLAPPSFVCFTKTENKKNQKKISYQGYGLKCSARTVWWWIKRTYQAWVYECELFRAEEHVVHGLDA